MMADDEWACLVPKNDGSQQIMIGVSLKNLTSTFPMVNLKEAVKEIIQQAPAEKKKFLSSLKVPELAGGEPDILLGILYESCHPRIVHTLESGLFIAKVRLANGQGYTAAIGGPHQSFARLVNQVGDSVRLMSYFAGGLKDYHNFGAPKLPAPLMSFEDIEFAKSMNCSEVADVIGGPVPDETDDDGNEVHLIDAMSGEFTFQCNACGRDISESLSDILVNIEELIGHEKMKTFVAAAKEAEPDEKLHDLKTLIKVQEEGLRLDYRCPKCRSCSDCRNASETERISLRGELEDQAIKESVTIDYEAQKISAKLPLRGDENKFLSNNRNIALKVLQSQCVKLKTDKVAKETVVKAFHKLLDNGYAVKLDDLSEEQKQRMLSKPLQHWLPWRTVYKDSVSTPCRPVFDGSSKCPVLEDGSGGHCLNNLTMKGRVNTLDLMTMLLRFAVGSAACAGDLKQFYCSIGLDESQWNLQRVLWKEGMEID